MLKKISSVVSLSFLVMFLFAVNVHSAPDWVNYGSDNYGVMLYQTLKIDKQGGNHIVQLLKKRVFSDTGKVKYLQATKKGGIWTKDLEKVSSIVLSNEIDCKKRMTRQTAIFIYDAAGKVIASESYNAASWTQIAPGSEQDSLRKKVCK